MGQHITNTTTFPITTPLNLPCISGFSSERAESITQWGNIYQQLLLFRLLPHSICRAFRGSGLKELSPLHNGAFFCIKLIIPY